MANINAYLRKDGRWEARIYASGTNGKRRYRSVYGQTKEETEKKALLFYNGISKPGLLTKMTVKELVLEYIQRKQPLLKASTVANYRMKAEKHIIPTLGEFVCTDISASDIYRFMEEKRRQKLSERYIYDILVLLKSVFRYANNTYGVRNIMSGIVMPKHGKPDVAVLSKNEQRILHQYLDRNPDLTSLAILLSLYTGLRIGELCALQWKDIDLEKRILTVNKTIQRVQISNGKNRTQLIITAPKSQSSVREIPLPECLVPVLRQYKASSDFFVLSANSKPVEPRTLQYRFAGIINNANLPSVHFHSLRHAFATNCVAAGFDVKTLSEILGHSSVELTLNRYVHSSMDRKRALMDMLTLDKVSA